MPFQESKKPLGFTPIRIREYTFHLPDSYAEGHELTAGEAQALNALRAENIRNNMAKVVAEAIGAEPNLVLRPEVLQHLTERVLRYAEAYEFVEKHRPRALAGLEAELMRVATERAEARLRAEGRGDLPMAEVEAIARGHLGDPEVQDEARKRLAERQQIARGALEDLL